MLLPTNLGVNGKPVLSSGAHILPLNGKPKFMDFSSGCGAGGGPQIHRGLEEKTQKYCVILLIQVTKNLSSAHRNEL